MPSTTPSNTAVPVTVLGLGPMGRALAAAFVQGGHPTTVWNRTAGKADELVAQGATAAASAAEAVAASELVIICVIDYDAVDSILESASAAIKGRTLVNVTADSPERARTTAAWAAEQGADYLDGTILTPTVTIGTPNAVFLFSGPEALYERHRDVLASLRGTATYLGTDFGRSAAYDVALLDFFWTSVSGLMHAFALAKKENIAARELAPFALGIFNILPPIMELLAGNVDDGIYPGEDSNVASVAAGIDHIIHAAEERNMDTGVLRAARAVAQRVIDEGNGTDGIERLAEVLSRPAK
ncbi:NAD(P)-dependent oxidoreductase [Streptomyces zagrosensis]|uniref:3-hydroxyisobutyrate dehydrogenase-like beta-hydroxyacid dehydrogenase n=1 Tax=Streptomyces zagrosensis TaxID=1042984 RepID=A0A7W9Q690_9ACTN|nr:NAD(P)-binding domain-containing protein [Streptomyces zagrosensis]MBB5934400.1 3-hydroxyisobutyrate dehydrogenase-like beta-hydroxyacid dehydrogenase [Streptomyces zagrosensis]